MGLFNNLFVLVAIVFTAAIIGQYILTFVFKDSQDLEIHILKSEVIELNVLVEELNTTTYEEIQLLNTSLTEDVNNLTDTVVGINNSLHSNISDLNVTLMDKIMQGDAILQEQILNINLGDLNVTLGTIISELNDTLMTKIEEGDTALAGGDLTGSYPNPTLKTTTVTAGSYGSSTQTGTFTVDSKGRLTAASSVTITGTAPGGAAGGDLTGLYPNPTLVASGITPGIYGGSTTSTVITFDSKGRALFASDVTISGVTPGGSAGGDLTGSYPNPTLAATTVTPGSYGSSTQSGTFTVDSKGRLTAASSVTITGVTPGGAAGGDLTGTYPSPTLVTTTVTPGTYGNSTSIPIITVDSKGRLTSAGTVSIALDAPSGPAGGDLTGFYPDPTLTTTTVTPGSYGSATQSGTFTVDSKGRLTAASSVTITGTVPGGAAGGDLTGTYPSPTLVTTAVTPGTYGNSTSIPIITVDSKGRLTSAGTVSIALDAPSGPAGGDLTGFYPDPTLAATAVTPGSYGSATQVGTFTVDSKGRLTTASSVTITGTSPGGVAGGVLSGTYPNPSFAQITLSALKTQIGFASTAVDLSLAIGPGATADDTESVVCGPYSGAAETQSTVVGYAALADIGSLQATLYGNRVYSDSEGSCIFGHASSTNNSPNAVAIGRSAIATNAVDSIAIGMGAFTTTAGAVAIGSNMGGTVANGFFVKHRDNITPTVARVAVYTNGTSELVGLPFAGGSGYVLTSDASGAIAWAAAGAGGSAGGDLTGTYPNPTLTTTTVTPGSYGSATQVGTFTVDNKGRLTAASAVTITGTTPGGAAGGDLTGTYPNPTLTTTTVTPGSYGSATQAGTFTVDSKGRLTTASSVTITGTTPGGAAGGDLTGTYPNPTLATSGVTAGTYEHMTATVDAKGRITSASRRETTVAMTLAEFTGLNGTPKVILPAPGVGFYYLVHDWCVSRTHGSAVLVLGSDVTLTYGNAAIAATAYVMPGASFTGTSNHIFVASGWGTASNAVRSDMENKAVNIRVTGASFTGGTGSSFQVSVFYSILPV